MKITIIYNRVTAVSSGEAQDLLADEDSVKTVREMQRTLLALGYQADTFDLNEETVDKVSKISADILFNQAFGIGNIADSEAEAARILEKSKLPFTGSVHQSLELSNDKLATKKLLVANQIPTPRTYQFNRSAGVQKFAIKFPVIVKLANQHCSIGLSQKSVVDNVDELQNQILELSKKYQGPFMVEEYIAGRELNVCILGNGKKARVLPISEILFSDDFVGKYKIIDFAAKWLEESEEYQHTLGARCPADLDEMTRRKIETIALKAYQVSACRDYGRVDMRLSANNEPYVLEINANPAIGPDDGAVRSAKAAGYTYPGFLQKIIEIAMERSK